LHEGIKKHEIDAGMRDGVTTAERERIKALEREVRERSGNCVRPTRFCNWPARFSHLQIYGADKVWRQL